MKDHVYASIDQVSASLLTFVFHIIAARAFSTDVYGWLVLIWGATGSFILLWRAAIGVPFVIEYSSAVEKGQPGLIRVLQTGSAAVRRALLAASAVLTALWVGWGRAEPILLFGAGAILLAALIYREEWRHVLIADLWSDRLGRLGVVSNLVGAIFFAVACLVLRSSPFAAVVMLAGGIAIGIELTRPRSYAAGDGNLVVAALRRWWLVGKDVLIGVLSVNGVSQILLWLLLISGGERDVAIFGAVMALIGFPRPVINAITAVLTPQVAREKSTGNHVAPEVLSTGVRVVSVLGVIFLIGCLLLGSTMVHVAFPSLPSPTTTLIGFLAVAMVFESANGILRGALRGSGLASVERKASVIGSLCGTVVGLALVPWIASTGAAAAYASMQAAILFAGVWFQRSASPAASRVWECYGQGH